METVLRCGMRDIQGGREDEWEGNTSSRQRGSNVEEVFKLTSKVNKVKAADVFYGTAITNLCTIMTPYYLSGSRI